MVNIDHIMDLLDWNNSVEDQKRGIELARDVKNFNVFFQPGCTPSCKGVWDNCAIIISEKTDEELTPYLIEMIEWLEDMNWPGADRILERLKRYERIPTLKMSMDICIKFAKALNNPSWENTIRSIIDDRDIS